MDAQTRLPCTAEPEAIQAIVRAFASRVLLLRAAFHAGEPDAEDPLKAIEHAAIELSSALGFTPYGLALCRFLVPEETKHYGDPAKGFFMWIAGQTVGLMQEIEEDAPEAEVMPRIDAMLDDVVARLTGEKY